MPEPGEDAPLPRYYVQTWPWMSQKHRIMARAKAGGDRQIAACWGEPSARKIVAALNAAEIGSSRGSDV